MSIAQAILEYINKHIKCKTLFSTHYHELTSLSLDFPCIKNVHVDAKEENGTVTFLHKVVNGPIDKSYGIHVAKLANMPEELLKRAYEILSIYEKNDTINNPSKQVSFNFDELDTHKKEETDDSEVVNYLKSLKVENLRPIDALLELDKLKKMLKD